MQLKTLKIILFRQDCKLFVVHPVHEHIFRLPYITDDNGQTCGTLHSSFNFLPYPKNPKSNPGEEIPDVDVPPSGESLPCTSDCTTAGDVDSGIAWYSNPECLSDCEPSCLSDLLQDYSDAGGVCNATFATSPNYLNWPASQNPCNLLNNPISNPSSYDLTVVVQGLCSNNTVSQLTSQTCLDGIGSLPAIARNTVSGLVCSMCDYTSCVQVLPLSVLSDSISTSSVRIRNKNKKKMKEKKQKEKKKNNRGRRKQTLSKKSAENEGRQKNKR